MIDPFNEFSLLIDQRDAMIDLFVPIQSGNADKAMYVFRKQYYELYAFAFNVCNVFLELSIIL